MVSTGAASRWAPPPGRLSAKTRPRGAANRLVNTRPNGSRAPPPARRMTRIGPGRPTANRMVNTGPAARTGATASTAKDKDRAGEVRKLRRNSGKRVKYGLRPPSTLLPGDPRLPMASPVAPPLGRGAARSLRHLSRCLRGRASAATAGLAPGAPSRWSGSPPETPPQTAPRKSSGDADGRSPGNKALPDRPRTTRRGHSSLREERARKGRVPSRGAAAR
jgi:hypothetical protein